MFQVSLDMAEETKMKESTAALLATPTAAGNLSALDGGKSGGEKEYGMTVLAIVTIIVLVFILFGGVSWIVHLSHRCAARCASASPPSATIGHSSRRSNNSSGDQTDGGSGGGGSGSGGGGGTGGTKGLRAKRQDSYVAHFRRVDVTVGGLLLKGYKKDRIFFWYDSCLILPHSFLALFFILLCPHIFLIFLSFSRRPHIISRILRPLQIFFLALAVGTLHAAPRAQVATLMAVHLLSLVTLIVGRPYTAQYEFFMYITVEVRCA
jgi:hypothetical protein